MKAGFLPVRSTSSTPTESLNMRRTLRICPVPPLSSPIANSTCENWLDVIHAAATSMMCPPSVNLPAFENINVLDPPPSGMAKAHTLGWKLGGR